MKSQIRKNIQEEWMKSPRQMIEARKNILEEEIAKKLEENKRFPEGKVRAVQHKNSFQYFMRSNPKDKSGKYIPSSQINLAKSLAQKEYNDSFIKAALKEKNILDTYLNQIPNYNIETIYKTFPEGKQKIIMPIIEPLDDYIKAWEELEYETNTYPFGDTNFYTNKNERVRSKSEMLIANTLNKYGVPYRYEFPVQIDGIIKYVDFYTLNVRTRQEIVYEHLGMMDDRGYAINNVEKINRYIANGYIPGENLIYTMETNRNQLDIRMVEILIKKYLL